MHWNHFKKILKKLENLSNILKNVWKFSKELGMLFKYVKIFWEHFAWNLIVTFRQILKKIRGKLKRLFETLQKLEENSRKFKKNLKKKRFNTKIRLVFLFPFDRFWNFTPAFLLTKFFLFYQILKNNNFKIWTCLICRTLHL